MKVDELLAQARAGLERLGPREALAAVREQGALLVDVRTAEQRARDGELPGALRHSLNHLEWRADQTAETPDPAFAGAQDRIVVVACDQGYSSSLAAARLQTIGFPHATDLDGGFQAWRAAGLPVEAPHTPDPPDVGAP